MQCNVHAGQNKEKVDSLRFSNSRYTPVHCCGLPDPPIQDGRTAKACRGVPVESSAEKNVNKRRPPTLIISTEGGFIAVITVARAVVEETSFTCFFIIFILLFSIPCHPAFPHYTQCVKLL